MTVATATNFTISHTVDQEILDELETSFDGFRSRIADMSLEASATLTGMFSPLGPVVGDVIDIEAIEWEQFELALVPADTTVLELAAA